MICDKCVKNINQQIFLFYIVCSNSGGFYLIRIYCDLYVCMLMLVTVSVYIIVISFLVRCEIFNHNYPRWCITTWPMTPIGVTLSLNPWVLLYKNANIITHSYHHSRNLKPRIKICYLFDKPTLFWKRF